MHFDGKQIFMSFHHRWLWLPWQRYVLNQRSSGYLVSPHADRYDGDISFTVCLFFVRRILVTDISGVGWHRAMNFCRMVDLGVYQVFSPLVNFGPGVSPQAKKWKIIGRSLARCDKLMRPVWQTGHRWRWWRSARGDYASPDNWRTCLFIYLLLCLYLVNHPMLHYCFHATKFFGHYVHFKHATTASCQHIIALS